MLTMSLVRTPEPNGNRVEAGELGFVRGFTINLLKNSPGWGRKCAAGRREGLFKSHRMGCGTEFISIVYKNTPIPVII